MGTNEMRDGKDLLLGKEVYAIVGAAMEVHNELGSGFAEAVYQEAMELELTARGIPFERQKKLRISYKGKLLEKEYIADLVCCVSTGTGWSGDPLSIRVHSCHSWPRSFPCPS